MAENSNPAAARWVEPGNQRGWARENLPSSETLSDISDALGAAKDGLGLLADLVRIVESALAADPMAGLAAIVGEAYSNLINDLMGTDIYVLPVAPKKWSDLLYPYSAEQATDDIVASLSDHMDPSVPSFSGGAPIASVTILVGADNWMDFRRILKDFSELFSDEQAGKWARLADLRFKFDRYRRRPVPRAERGTQGVPWDWYRSDWMDLVPPIGNALRTMADWVDQILGIPMGLASGIDDLVNNLLERMEYIARLAEDIGALLAFLERLDRLIPTMSVLGIYSDRGGITAYADAIKNAGNKPQHKLTAGVTLLFAGANPMAQYDIMKNLIGLKLQSLENAAAQAEQRAAQ